MATTTTAGPTRHTRLNLSRRPRRLRASAAVRSLVRETQLTPECLIYPIFVCEGQGIRKPIGSMASGCNACIPTACSLAPFGPRPTCACCAALYVTGRCS